MKIKVVGNVPKYAKPGDAGADLVSAEDVTIGSRSRVLVKTGTWIEMPEGYVGLIHPRSGLAVKSGITVLNSPGTIDAGYRGEIGVILYNTSFEPLEVSKGDRIAQLIIQQFETADFEVVDALTDSERGDGGFGSTGLRSV